MQQKYRLYRRRNGKFYWQENDSGKQGSLKTSDRHEAQTLLNAMNESRRQPILNLALARSYLAAHDPRMITRTWQEVIAEMSTHGIPTTQERCSRAFSSKAYSPIRSKPLVQTTAGDLLAILHNNGNCVAHYLRRLHNLAVDLGWLAWPILAKRAWPKVRSQTKRAITAEEHKAVIASEKNSERRAYYELLYETGAAQTDAANLTADNIDWQNGILLYHRKKLGPFSEPARLTIGRKLWQLLQFLPRSGDLFPNINKRSANHRSAEFRRRCRIAGVRGVSLHRTVMLGRSELKPADTRSDSLKKRCGIPVAPHTKHMPKVHAFYAQPLMSLKMRSKPKPCISETLRLSYCEILLAMLALPSCGSKRAIRIRKMDGPNS